MYVFPPVGSKIDEAQQAWWQLPLAGHTALGLYEVLVCHDASRLAEYLMIDPPALLWVSCHLPPEAASWTLAEVAERALASWTDWWGDSTLPEVTPFPRKRSRWSEWVERSLGTAALAASSASEPQAAYWLGALIEAAEWFSASGPAVRQVDLASGGTALPAWLGRRIAAARQGKKDSPVAAAVAEAYRRVKRSGLREALSESADASAIEDIEQAVALWRAEGSGAAGAGAGPIAAWSGGSDLPGRCLWKLTRMCQTLRQMEESFERRLEEAKLAAMAELAYGASHEINNPLANISSRAQTLLQQESDPERRRQLATIEAQAYRAYEMIADMMLFAKPPQPDCAACDPVVLAREVVSELQAAARAQETELLEESTEVDGRVWCDRVQIETALRALVQNALEAVGRGGRVTVSAGRDERSWWWSVTDTGPGLSEKARRHLFDPFFSGREAGRGLGLGLSKVWAIARQHGGEVTVDAPAGRGVSIRLAIPALEPQVQGEG